MKMHAEKKHKCSKCNNGYSTEWDLKRHIEDCGKTYECTCGCPYASRAALLSHIYRTGHEIPTEHRHVKKESKWDTIILMVYLLIALYLTCFSLFTEFLL